MCGKRIHGNDPCAGKWYSHDCTDQKVVKEVEQRYCPQAMGSGGELKQTG